MDKSTRATCSIEGCAKPARARGWCKTHYERWRRTGDTELGPPPPCSVAGCDREHLARGFCKVHYDRHRRGQPLEAPIRQRRNATCVVDGCDESHVARGYCRLHYERFMRTGSVSLLIDRGERRAGETWRPIPGYGDLYEVSDLGRVRSLDRVNVHPDGRRVIRRGRLLRPHRLHRGYLNVTLHRDGEPWGVGIHRLVALAFIGPAPEGHEVNHRNSQPTDNRPENLEYVTRAENMAHATALGRVRGGGGRRLTAEDVRAIREARGALTQRQLAERFGVSQEHVRAIQARRCWKSVP